LGLALGLLVIPAKAGIQFRWRIRKLDPDLRRDDDGSLFAGGP
jgi:hypothetical protein